MLPAKRKPAKSGVMKGPKREWPRHRSWVRKHMCCVPDCEQGPVQFAHVRSAANAGTGIKPHDAWGVSLCFVHHSEQHRTGDITFSEKHGINLLQLAFEFARKSPVSEVQEFSKEMVVL